MAIILAQAIIHTDSGVPEDFVVNTFHFNGAATDPVAEDLSVAITNFYNAHNGLDASVAQFLSTYLVHSSAVHELKFYDVTSGPGGTPFYVDTFGFTDAPLEANGLPDEVAVCLSYKATPLPGAVEARRRGRIYVGPLNGASSAGSNRPVADLQAALLYGTQQLHDDAAAANAPWVVYSRVNDTTALITDTWVDNSFDTQRRRGVAATSRATLAL